MSAIFGIIDKRNLSVNSAEIELMQHKLLHHAVEGQRVFIKEGAMLAYHQLVLHVSEEKARMPYESNDYVIVSDLRIDNGVQLIKLLGLAEKPDEVTAEKLVVEAFIKWGENCVDYLEGEFSFLIYHKITHSFFAASDPIGHRSFYYYDSAEHFIFASEIKAVLAMKPSPHSFNEAFIIKCFVRNYDGNTYIHDIQALKGGHYLTYNSEKGLCLKKYWTARIPGKYNFKTLADWGECLRELMTEAIEHRIDINQPMGVKLSGGLDSSFVTALLSETLLKKNKSFTAFSSVLKDDDPQKSKDESFYINLLGKHLPNMEQVFITPPKNINPFDNLEQLFAQGDGAFNPFHYLDTLFLEAARDRNIRLLFNGYGGDHAISNSRKRYVYESVKRLQLGEVFRVFRLLKKTYGHSTIRLIRSDILTFIPFYAFLKKLLKRQTDTDIAYFMPSIEEKILAIDKIQSVNQRDFLLEAMNAGNLGREHQELYYRDAYFGLRKTTPFFDKKIVEFYLDIPEKVLFENGYRRGLIREAMRGIVPDEIVWRKSKNAYSPDFNDRIDLLKVQKNKLLYNAEYAFARPYMNQKNVAKQLDKGDIYATMVVLIFSFIQSLKNQQIL
ncbi:asparagine synthase-related protein [Emticicia fontis]